MRQYLKSILVVIGLVAVGFLMWFFTSKTPIVELASPRTPIGDHPNQDKLTIPKIEIAGMPVTADEVQWEIDLHTKVPKFKDSDEVLGLPKPVDTDDEKAIEITSGSDLRDRILSSMIERKVSYQYIVSMNKIDVDSSAPLPAFDVNDPARFTKCIAQLSAVAQESGDFFADPKSRQRLKAKLCEESLVEQYLTEVVFKSLATLPSEVEAYYKKHEKSFKRPTRVILKQIVVATEDTAIQLRKIVNSNNFSELAKKHSITPEGPQGGSLGPFAKEQLPTLFDIAFSMNAGDISGVVKSEFGYHIIMLVDRLPAQTLNVASATPQIRTEIMRQKKLDAYQKWLNLAMNAIRVNSSSSGTMP